MFDLNGASRAEDMLFMGRKHQGLSTGQCVMTQLA